MKFPLIIFISALTSFIPLFIFWVSISFSGHYQSSQPGGLIDSILILVYLYFPYIFTGLTSFLLTRMFSLKEFIIVFISSELIAYLLNSLLDPDSRSVETFITVTTFTFAAFLIAKKLSGDRPKELLP